MTNKTAAIRYARALLDVAVKEKADLEQIEHELPQFADLFTQYPLLEKVLLNPAVPVPRKRAAVAELLAQAKFTPIVSKLLALLADRDRLVLRAGSARGLSRPPARPPQRRPRRSHDRDAARRRARRGDSSRASRR